MSELTYIGQLNRLVGLYKWTDTKNASSEAVKTPVLIKEVFVKRGDSPVGEDEDGRLVGLSTCKFVMRYNADVLLNGSKYFIRDEDGDYEVNSVTLINEDLQRKRFIELKCGKRG
jgi:hypothetical protein